MNQHPFDTLTLDNGASLIFTPCPGSKGASLEASVAQLKSAGASLLLTLMFDDEMARNSATALPAVCKEHGLAWLQLPIIDDDAPGEAFERQWQAHRSAIVSVLANQGTVAVHCKGGTGRTGLVIALILAAHGWPGEKIIDAVQAIRPKALRLPVQLDYVNARL